MTESVFCLSQSPESEIEKELWELLHFCDDTQGYIVGQFLPFETLKRILKKYWTRMESLIKLNFNSMPKNSLKQAKNLNERNN